jgi:hypothetical protein
MAKSLDELRKEYLVAAVHFEDTIARLFPGADKWTWYRALAHINGTIGRRNDDTSRDEALAASTEIKVAYDVYLNAIHTFYLARDGERGFLGGRGM